jgi:4-alpha-glucanotransferase
VSTDAFGITDGYYDVSGGWHETTPETRAALRVAMGVAPDAEHPPAARPLWFVRCGDTEPLDTPCHLVLEGGTDLGVLDALPADLPLGYHDLVPVDGGATTRLVASPQRCHLPEGLHDWLWSVQVYAARSSRSWGIGDLADLATLAKHASRDGARGVMLSPLHAPLPTSHQEPSPYFSSTRRWRNPLHLAIDAVPGAAANDVAALGLEARALLATRIIDRDAVWALKRQALDVLWARARDRTPDAAYLAWRDAQGASLLAYARFCALAEHHDADWRDWPEEHQHPESPAVARFAATHAERVELHAWIQWLLHEQLAAIDEVDVIADLAIGVDPGGADAWLHQDLFALDVCVGAPPDEFAVDGQDWGLPPFVPWKLREVAYEPFIETLRSAMSTRGLRVDHVMGLFRLFWIPPDATPAGGAYVRWPGRELLDLVCIESTRAGALVIGEDLGTVEDEVRSALHDAAVLSYRVMWFEDEPPEAYPHQALAAVTTHDLPTIAGAWTGNDAEQLRSIGRDEDADAVEGLRDRLLALGVPDGASAAEAVRIAHERLAAASTMLVAATLDDALVVAERPNVPGTTDELPNWSIALPALLDDALDAPGVEATAAAMRRAGRGSPPQG